MFIACFVRCATLFSYLLYADCILEILVPIQMDLQADVGQGSMCHHVPVDVHWTQTISDVSPPAAV